MPQRAKKTDDAKRKAFHLYFLEDRGMYRVGRSDNPGDVFEIVTKDRLDEIEKLCGQLKIDLVEIDV